MRPNDSIGFMISTTARKINQCLTAQFDPYGITSEQWSVLNHLSQNDGITQKELSQITEKDPTNVTRILDQLERKGLVRRKANPTDRRSFQTFITENGKQINEKLAPMEKEFVQHVLTQLSEDEISVLREALLQINDTLDKRREH